jgi:hypothetical protein
MADTTTPNKPPAAKTAAKENGTVRASNAQARDRLRASMSQRAAADAKRRADLAKQKKERQRAAILGRRRFSINETQNGKIACFPSTKIVGGIGKSDESWICAARSQYQFREKNYAVQEAEVRIFIEGAEVTNHVRGSVQWSYQTTGGMNTCSFTLNNNQDVFIITPANICAGPDRRNPGWRLARRNGEVVRHQGRGSQGVDELAKYIIYWHKYNRVFVNPSDSKSWRIDEDGIWLYPLDPYKSIFHTHDCVRVFYRLPHVSGVALKDKKNGKTIKAKELWAPAFTGFISDHDFEDDPVTGDRFVNIRCYDFRGLLDRMRVRVLNASIATIGEKDVTETSPLFGKQRARRKAAQARQAGGNDKGKYDDQFIKDLIALGLSDELQGWFTHRADADVAKNCPKKDNSYDKECIAKTVDAIKQEIQQFITPLELALRNANKAMEELNDLTGKKHSLQRVNDFSVKLAQAKSVADDVREATPKAVGILKATGKVVEQYIEKYAQLYRDTVITVGAAVGGSVRTAGSVQTSEKHIPNGDDGSSVPPKIDNSFTTGVTFSAEVLLVDTDFSAKYETIYDAAKIPSDTSINRIFILNAYLNSLIDSALKNITDKYKKELDKLSQSAFGQILFNTKTAQAQAGAGSFKFYPKGKVDKLIDALQTAQKQNLVLYDNAHKGTTDAIEAINALLPLLQAQLLGAVQGALSAAQRANNLREHAQRLRLRDEYLKRHTEGAGTKDKKGNEGGDASMAGLVVKDVHFTTITAGMFQELVRAQERDAHPLAGMSFENAVMWLTLTHLLTSPGYEWNVGLYNTSKLESWNHAMVFGVLGRPMTYEEVTEMGNGTITEFDVNKGPFSPSHCFVHLLLPENGTGASTIVQQDITHNAGEVRSFEYSSRLALLNEICELLDYQFFVTPVGDLAFEFPHYNAVPSDFGGVFSGAYTVARGLRNCRVSTNESQINTAWVLTGSENERIVDDVTNEFFAENIFKKAVLVAPMLTSRIGAKVKKIKMSLPGVGAVYDDRGPGKPLSALLAFGLLQMQRELGKIETMSVTHEFRPYLLPNRPIHVLHRQRIGLTRTINYSMSVGGECSSQSELHYIRGIRRDGAFSFMGIGGVRMPVDYSSWYSGDVKQDVKYGPQEGKVSAAMGTKVLSGELNRNVKDIIGGFPKTKTNYACGTYIQDRYLEAANSYGDQIDASFTGAAKYNVQTSGVAGDVIERPNDPSQGLIGSRTVRRVENKGQPISAVQLSGTGVQVASGPTDGKQDKTTKSAYGRLHNPWPYGVYDANVQGSGSGSPASFNQWGFFRLMTDTGDVHNHTDGMKGKNGYVVYRPHSGKIGRWHNGVDFNNLKNLTKAYTPIPLVGIHAVHHTGSNHLNAKERYEKWEYQLGSTIPSYILNLCKRNSDGTPYVTYEARVGNKYVTYYVENVAYGLNYKLSTHKYKGKSVIVPISTSNSNMGLSIHGFGFVTLPHSPDVRVACRVSYLHCGDLAPRPAGGWYGDGRFYPNEADAPADEVVALVGQSGTSNVHLHYELEVYPPGKEPAILRTHGETDASAWKEILSANEAFLRTSMRLKLTSGPGATPNGAKLSSQWQAYFNTINNKTGQNITTVDQATDYMLSVSEKYKNFTEPGKGKSVYTNPLFFFKPEQIIKDYARRYEDWHNKFDYVYFDPKNSGASVCGVANAVQKQRIYLDHTICRLKASKTNGYNTKKKQIKDCRTAYDTALAAIQGKASNNTAVAERVDRKLDAKTKRKVQGPRKRGNEKTSGA